MKQNCVRMEEVISLNVELHSAKELATRLEEMGEV